MPRSPTKIFTADAAGATAATESRRDNKRKKPDCDILDSIKTMSSSLNNSINDLRGDIHKQLSDISSNLSTIRTELDCLSASTKELKSDIETLHTESALTKKGLAGLESHRNITTQNISELQATTQFTSDQLSGLQIRVTALENTHRSPIPAVSVLEAKIDSLEQQARQNNLEICNVPEKRGENLTSILESICTTIKCTISQVDIAAIHRVPHALQSQNNRPKNIICKLISRTLRDNILSAFRMCKGTSSDKIGISGTSTRIFMNEHLTLQNKMLFRECRERAKDHGYQYVWIKHATILVRETDTSPAFAVRTKTDLAKIKPRSNN